MLSAVLRKRLFSAALCAALVFGGAAQAQPQLRGVFLHEAGGVPVRTAILGPSSDKRPGIRREIKYIVIHETGNYRAGADARMHTLYVLNNPRDTTSWHYTVDDRVIYHHIPDDEIAWHAGDRQKKNGGNANGVAIELCVNADGDFRKTLDNGAKLTARLLKAYGLGLDAVRQHGDFIDKDCPATLRASGGWEAFLAQVRAYREKM